MKKISQLALIAATMLLPILMAAQTTWVVNGNNVNTDAKIGTNTGYDLILETNNLERARLTDEGKLGVGTISPEEKLHVVGNFSLEGAMKFKEWAEQNGEMVRLLYIDPEGNAKKLEMPDMVRMLYHLEGVDCVVGEGQNYPVPIWQNSSNQEYGIIYTGTSCQSHVGIGLSNPVANLDVDGVTRVTRNLSVGSEINENSMMYSSLFGDKTGILLKKWENYEGTPFRITSDLENPAKDNFRIRFDGGQDIMFNGNSSDLVWSVRNSERDLAILDGNGNFHCRAVRVKSGTFWPDYVFGADSTHTYERMSLAALDNYIKANHKLPNVPSASEVEKEGLDMYETSRMLMEKVEELTLYILEQNERMNHLEEELTKMKAQDEKK